MDRETRERFEELSRQYPNTAADVLENTQDMGFEPWSDAEYGEALSQLEGQIDAGEAS